MHITRRGRLPSEGQRVVGDEGEAQPSKAMTNKDKIIIFEKKVLNVNLKKNLKLETFFKNPLHIYFIGRKIQIKI